MKQILAGVIIGVFLTAYSCKGASEPERIKTIEEYSWKTDTLKNSVQVVMRKIYAADENDIWLIGHNASRYGKMWRYINGKWEMYEAIQKEEGYPFYEGIIGFGSKDIWICGLIEASGKKNSMVAHYTGSWEIIRLPGEETLYDIWGENSNELWACGLNGVIWHYLNGKWEKEQIKAPLSDYDFYKIYQIIKIKNNDLIAMGYNHNKNGDEIIYLYKRGIINWIVIDSMKNGNNKFGIKSFLLSPDNKLYSIGSSIYRYEENNWIDELRIPQEKFIGGLSILKTGEMLAIDTKSGSLFYKKNNNWVMVKKLFNEMLFFTNIWWNGKKCIVIANPFKEGPDWTIIKTGE